MADGGSGGISQIRQRLAGLFYKRAAGQQFMDPRAHSWAKAVKSYSDLPSQYRPFFESHILGMPDALPYSVLTPTFRGGYGRPEPERLLCIIGGSVHVLEFTGGRLTSACYDPGQVAMIEYGVLLLHSWITIHSRGESGSAQSVTVRFNSVSDYLMAPFVDCLRGPAMGGSTAGLEMERARLDYLAETHYKFRTYGRTSLRAGATVHQTIFQHEIRHVRMRLLGISFTRLVSPAHLSILTNSELITIRDDPSQRWSKGSPHGAIWTYIPRSKISGAVLTSRADGRQELSVDLQGGLGVRSLFDSEMIPYLEDLRLQLMS